MDVLFSKGCANLPTRQHHIQLRFLQTQVSCESARNELPQLKSCLLVITIFQHSYYMKMESLDFEYGIIYLKIFGAEKVNEIV